VIFAQLSFWYGLPYREIRYEMPFSAIQAYSKQLPKLQAELRLMLGEAASVPHLEKDSRQGWVRELSALTGKAIERPRVVPRAVLAMRGILVVDAN